MREADKGAQKVGDDFELIVFDFVSNPSTHGLLHPVNEGVVKESISNDKWGKEHIIHSILRED